MVSAPFSSQCLCVCVCVCVCARVCVCLCSYEYVSCMPLSWTTPSGPRIGPCNGRCNPVSSTHAQALWRTATPSDVPGSPMDPEFVYWQQKMHWGVRRQLCWSPSSLRFPVLNQVLTQIGIDLQAPPVYKLGWAINTAPNRYVNFITARATKCRLLSCMSLSGFCKKRSPIT
jgi:hypothetical protein